MYMRRHGQADLLSDAGPAQSLDEKVIKPYPFEPLVYPTKVILPRGEVADICARRGIVCRIPAVLKQLSPELKRIPGLLDWEPLDREMFPSAESVQLGLFNVEARLTSFEIVDKLKLSNWHAASLALLLDFGNRFFPQDMSPKRMGERKPAIHSVAAMGMRTFVDTKATHPTLVPERGRWSLEALPIWDLLPNPNILVLAWSRP